MKLVYLGTPEAAVAPLHSLVRAGHEIALVLSQPDRRRGRGAGLSPSPVKSAATALGLPVSDDLNAVMNAAADGAELGIVVAFGKLIPPRLLAVLPFVNLHFSLLPRWRGAAPVERALLAGDRETGVCLMGLDVGLDTGPVYRRAVTNISSTESVGTLRERLVQMGSDMLVDALAGGFATLGTAEDQVGEPTYAAKLDPTEFVVNWGRSSGEISRLVRLGGAWTTFRDRRLKVLDVSVVREGEIPDGSGTPGDIDGVDIRTADGAVRLFTVQSEGKPAMAAAAWRNGAQPRPGERLGSNR